MNKKLILFLAIGAIGLCLIAIVCFAVFPFQSIAPGSPYAEPIDFRGEGDKVIEFVSPGNGPARITLGHNGTGNFAAVLKNSEGQTISLLANEIGDYQGEKIMNLDSGTYFIEITASDVWFVVILPPQ